MDWAGPINLGRRWRGPWALSKIVEAVAVVFFLVVGFSIFMSMGRPKTLSQIALSHPGHCNFPAIFNFGDSNSDTGGKSAAFSRLLSPNGDTFFGKTSGRYCDGQLVIDFIGECSHCPSYLFPEWISLAMRGWICWTNTHLKVWHDCTWGMCLCRKHTICFFIWFVYDMSNIVCCLYLLFLMGGHLFY